MKRIFLWYTIVSIVVCFQSVWAEDMTFKAVQLLPVNETNVSPEALKFFEAFRQAIEDRDVDFLLAHVDDQIRIDFGEPKGKEEFIRAWKLDGEPQDSEIWQVLRDLMALGGTFAKQGGTAQMTFPYVYSRFPEDFDSYTYGAITGKKVNMRKAPVIGSPIVTKLTYEIVKFLPIEEVVPVPINGEIYPWRKIITAAGQGGYVWGKYARSPLDYRAIFIRQKDSWKMTVFVQGD